MEKYQWRDGMQEISGFGGGYEACCREMLARGMAWLDAHPEADPKFRGFKNVYGLCIEDNADAEAFSKAMMEGPLAKEFGATGAMHQAVTGKCLFIRAKGWEEFCKQMSQPDEPESATA